MEILLDDGPVFLGTLRAGRLQDIVLQFPMQPQPVLQLEAHAAGKGGDSIRGLCGGILGLAVGIRRLQGGRPGIGPFGLGFRFSLYRGLCEL